MTTSGQRAAPPRPTYPHPSPLFLAPPTSLYPPSAAPSPSSLPLTMATAPQRAGLNSTRTTSLTAERLRPLHASVVVTTTVRRGEERKSLRYQSIYVNYVSYIGLNRVFVFFPVRRERFLYARRYVSVRPRQRSSGGGGRQPSQHPPVPACTTSCRGWSAPSRSATATSRSTPSSTG